MEEEEGKERGRWSRGRREEEEEGEGYAFGDFWVPGEWNCQYKNFRQCGRRHPFPPSLLPSQKPHIPEKLTPSPSAPFVQVLVP